MKITPINFASILEPHLLRFWSRLEVCDPDTLTVQRSHNFKHTRTTVQVLCAPQYSEPTLLGTLLLTEIPQQEHNAALCCAIILPQAKTPVQLLMVFKKTADEETWCERIIQSIETQLQRIESEQVSSETTAQSETGPPPPSAPKPEKPSEKIEEAETTLLEEDD